MNPKSQISELYFMIFNENPDSDVLDSLLEDFNKNNNSIEHIENNLRNSDKFKILSKKLEIQLEVAELYYILLNRKPDLEGLIFYSNKIINNNKSINWVEETIKNSDEYKSKIS